MADKVIDITGKVQSLCPFMTRPALVMVEAPGMVKSGAAVPQVVNCEVACAKERCSIWNGADNICGMQVSWGLNELRDMTIPCSPTEKPRVTSAHLLIKVLSKMLTELEAIPKGRKV